MDITLNLSPEQEIELRDSLKRRDRQRARQILTEAIDPTVDSLLGTDRQLSPMEFEQLANELINRVKVATKGHTPVLTNEDINRAGIYKNHP